MIKKHHPRHLILFITGMVILILSLGFLQALDLRALQRREVLHFSSPDGDALSATYLPGSIDAGVMILEGFGSDQTAMRPLASAFHQAGFHVFTFDFSGHGLSEGALHFDNAATDRLAQETLAARQVFLDHAGLTSKTIMMLGHSLGARVALQTACMDADPVKGLILIGTQVNLSHNAQSAFFTGVSDADLTWVQQLSAANPATHILLLNGSWDDILPPAAAQALLDKLDTSDPLPDGMKMQYSRQLIAFPALFHNYEIWSTRVIGAAKSFAIALLLHETTEAQFIVMPNVRAITWASALAGLMMALIGLVLLLRRNQPPVPAASQFIKIIHPQRFIFAKFWLWLPALPIAAVLSGLICLIPAGLPVFNLIYVGFIGGYGGLVLLLYCLGKGVGTSGKLKLNFSQTSRVDHLLKQAGFWLGMLFFISMLLVVILLTRSGLFNIYPLKTRLLWLIVLTPFTTVGFWVAKKEAHMLEDFHTETGKPVRMLKTLHTFSGLTPFLLYTALMAVLGSTSGMLGGLQGILALLIVTLSGSVLQYLIKKAWVTAVLQAMLLYAIILPQRVLFQF